MDWFCSILIIIAVLLFRSGTKQNKKSQALKKKGKAVFNKAKNTTLFKDAKETVKELTRENTEEVKEQPTDIELRRMQQHENYKRSRIHQNAHSNIEKVVDTDTTLTMSKIRDLIVCGYPVTIPGERDFIREGEAFLESLHSDSIFL